MVMFISLIVTVAVSGRVPTSLLRVSRHSLSVNALFKVGIGKQGDIVLEDYDTTKLYMYEFDGKRYVQKLDKIIPSEIGTVCHKAVNSDGDLFLQNGTDKDTICYSSVLRKKYSVNHKGRLRDSIDGELFYVEVFNKFFKTKWRIRVYNDNHGAASTSHTGTAKEGKPLTLLPPWKDSDYCSPSVCRVQQNYVVVDYRDRALDVFDPKGMIQCRLIRFEKMD